MIVLTVRDVEPMFESGEKKKVQWIRSHYWDSLGGASMVLR